MADKAVFDVKFVMKKVKELLVLESHIVDSERRKAAWEGLEENGSIIRTLELLIDLYQTSHSIASKKKSSYASFTIDFFARLGKSFKTSDIYADEQLNLDDRTAMYNFLGHCMFVYGQNLVDEEGDCQTVMAEVATAGKSNSGPVPAPPRGTRAVFTPVPETTRGLLSLGGGCMGEIWKVSKKRIANKTLSRKQIQQAQQMYDLTFLMKMTAEEKKDGRLPIAIRIRDRGGLFIPKMTFLPFLRKTNTIVMKYANEDSYRRYGKGMLKVCMAEVANTVALWDTFEQACELPIPDIPIDQWRMYFKEWSRKLAHARLAEFILGQTQMLAVKEGKRTKGGQTLRDKLFALTAKQRGRKGKAADRQRAVKRVSEDRVEAKSNKGKEPLHVRKTGKDYQVRRTCHPKNREKVERKEVKVKKLHVAESNSSVADGVLQATGQLRSKRKRVRSRLLQDFVE